MGTPKQENKDIKLAEENSVPLPYSWSFRYEGASEGLEGALSNYAKTIFHPSAQTQFALVQTLLNASVSSSWIRVIARGDEGIPSNNLANLAIEFITVR